MAEEQAQVTTLTDYIVEVMDGKNTIHEGPLRDEICQQLAQLYDKKKDNATAIAFEDQALSAGIFAGIWSAISNSSLSQKLNACGYFYSVDAQAVTAKDVAKFQSVAADLTPDQKKLSCLFIKLSSTNATHSSDYLPLLIKAANLYGVRVVHNLHDYKDQVQGLP